MSLSARETKENRHGLLKEMGLNQKIATYVKCPLKELNKFLLFSNSTPQFTTNSEVS